MHSNWSRESDTYGSYIDPISRQQQIGSSKHSHPGGFVFLRFEDAAYNVVSLALKSQQSICRSGGGYWMGTARKGRIFVYEDAKSTQQNWYLSRNKSYKDYLTTENAVCVFWFTKIEAATAFFENTHHNPFREACFPSQREYDAFYVPLLSAPTEPLNTFFCIEFLNARDYTEENFTQFEGEVRADMLSVFKNCLPMVVSSISGRAVLKPGSMISANSKLYISRFDSQNDVDRIWELGMIQALRRKWRLTGSINVYSMTIELAG